VIPKITPKIQSKFTQTPQSRLSQREVRITTKNGKARIQDVYIGGIPRTSLIDVLRDLFETYFT